MERDGVAADEHELNPAADERLQQISEIVYLRQ